MAIYLEVQLRTQVLIIYENEKILKEYQISTAKNGAGEQYGSEQTPRGWHLIRAKIGEGHPVNTVFVRRRPTGEIYTKELSLQFPERDWILTRIFWLSGLELHKNRFGNVDTMRRKIYIHGAPDSVAMGVIGSKGCIRMRNADLIDLFGQIPAGTKILIKE